MAQSFTLEDRQRFGRSANDGARRAGAARYLAQTLVNAPRIAREGDAAALDGLAAGLPAVIAAAGPSLDRNLHDLWHAGHHAVVIACDTAARPLLNAGIDPNIIVAADSNRSNAAHLSSLPPTRAWLVGEGSLHPSAFAHFERRTFAFKVSQHQPWPWLATVGLDRTHIETWGSVATSACSLAIRMGCDPIIFLGADFAFSEGRPYCRGTSLEPQWASWVQGGATYEAIWQHALDRWPLVKEPDVTGEPVWTAPHLLSFRDWLVERAGIETSRRFVNGTGAGLLAGPRIEQASAAALLLERPPVPRTELDAAIARAHRASAGDPARLYAGIESLLAKPSSRALREWTAFTDDAVPADQLLALLRSPEFDAWSLARTGVPQVTS